MKLNVLHAIPEGLLNIAAKDVYKTLKSPTLIHLTGIKKDPLFISVLLHGNEITGWDAICQLLQQYSDKSLPRSISLFIGNIKAAKENKRVLPEQMDYNRAWQISKNDKDISPEQQLMQDVINEMSHYSLFASIDIHNNTGLNPHYACVNKKENSFYHLALLFSQTVVYFIKPDTVQSMAFSNLCPSVTLECGQPGEKNGVSHVLQYLETVLNLNELSKQNIQTGEMHLYHTMAVVKLPENISFGFNESNTQINFHKDLESYNFKAIETGTVWADLSHTEAELLVTDEQGNNVFDQYYQIKNSQLISTKAVMPAMITLNHEIIRQDCLCYIMEQLT